MSEGMGFFRNRNISRSLEAEGFLLKELLVPEFLHIRGNNINSVCLEEDRNNCRYDKNPRGFAQVIAIIDHTLVCRVVDAKLPELVLVGEVEYEIDDHKDNLDSQRPLQEVGEDPDIGFPLPDGSKEACERDNSDKTINNSKNNSDSLGP